MRSRASGPGWLRGDIKVSGRRVTCKAPLAHLVGGSGRSETSPTAILQGTHSLEGEFREVRLLINSPKFAQGCSWWHHVYRWKGSARIRQAGRKGERYALYAVLPHPHGRGERGG